MAIPALQHNGLLPSGVHDCTIDDIRDRFAWNPHRTSLLSRFIDFFTAELRPLFSEPVFFDGSFVTDKEDPEDTDVVLDLTLAPDARKWQGLLYLQINQARIKKDYGVHFWINLPGQNDFAAFFQYVGVKTARLKGLHPQVQKGILRVA